MKTLAYKKFLTINLKTLRLVMFDETTFRIQGYYRPSAGNGMTAEECK